MHTSDNVTAESLERWQHSLQGRPWSYGEPAAAWNHVLEARQGNHDDDNEKELKTVADAFADHVTQDRPWRKASWDEYVRRSMKWHYDHARTGDQILRNRPMMTFPHPGEEIQLGNLTAKPITDSHRLTDAGAEMDNALAWYAERCATGESLIYTIHQDGQETIAAAMELTRDTRPPGDWKVHQVKGPRNIRATPEQMAIANHIASAVNANRE